MKLTTVHLLIVFKQWNWTTCSYRASNGKKKCCKKNRRKKATPYRPYSYVCLIYILCAHIYVLCMCVCIVSYTVCYTFTFPDYMELSTKMGCYSVTTLQNKNRNYYIYTARTKVKCLQLYLLPTLCCNIFSSVHAQLLISESVHTIW